MRHSYLQVIREESLKIFNSCSKKYLESRILKIISELDSEWQESCNQTIFMFPFSELVQWTCQLSNLELFCVEECLVKKRLLNVFRSGVMETIKISLFTEADSTSNDYKFNSCRFHGKTKKFYPLLLLLNEVNI